MVTVEAGTWLSLELRGWWDVDRKATLIVQVDEHHGRGKTVLWGHRGKALDWAWWGFLEALLGEELSKMRGI